MRGPIEARIAALRGQVRRLLALHGFSRLVTGLVLAILVAGLADWLFRLVPEVRLVLLLGVIGISLWLLITRVLRPLIVKFADLDIALRIEKRWPGLNDRLASTVQFLRQTRDDSSLGSQALRDATIEQTRLEVEGIDFRQAADPRSTVRAVAAAAVAVGAIAGVFWAEPTLSRIALSRLFRPFGRDQWPQATHLTILPGETPTKIAKGMPFTLVVAVAKGERLPSTAQVTYFYPDGEKATESLRPTDDGTFRGRLDSVIVPFSFTVEAGDDVTQPWSVAVVPPPTLDKTTVKVLAPAYTALASQTLAPGNTQVRAIEGGRIEFDAVANKPIASALLRRGDSPAKEPVKILADGLSLSTAFDVKESQPFWLELKDTEGFASQEIIRFDVRVVKDEAPRVSVDEPSHDRDVPPGASVPLQFTIDDDFGIQLVRLVYKVAAGSSEPMQEQIIPLWDAPQPHGEGGPIKHREVKYRWDLATLPNAQPGSVISFYADARDFDNIKGPNLGKSREMRLRIVSKEDADRLLEEKLREIRETAERIAAIQKQAKTPVDDAIRTLARTEKLPEPLREQVKNAEIIQRQVNDRVTNKSDGLEQKVRELQRDTRDFKVDNPDTDRQLTAIREAVDRIKENNLNPADKALNQAVKGMEQPDGANPQPNDAKPQEANPEGQPDKNLPGAQPKAQQAKAQAGAQPKGEQPQGEAAQGEQPKGDASKEQGGNQPKAKGAASKGASPQGQQAKGDQAKGEQGGEQAKGEQGGEQPKGDGQTGQPQPPKAGQQGPPASDPKQPPTTPKKALAEAEKNQKAIVEELDNLVAGLGQFDEMKDRIKDVKSLLRQQEELMKQAADVAARPDMAGKSQDSLTPDQKAELANQAAKQNELAKGVQNAEAKLNEMASKLDATDPLAARAARDAAEQARKNATAPKMGEIADQLDKNQMQQARAGQEQARNDLKKMIAELEDRKGKELSRLVAELKAAEADLKKLRDQQAANLKKTQQAGQEQDPQKRADELKKLAKEQKQLQEELKKQMAKLAKLNNQAGAKPGQKASDAMAKAQGKLDQDQGEEAEGEQEEALQDLKQAQQEVAEVRKEAEEQLAMEQLVKMSDDLKSLLERQGKLVTETEGYEKTRAANDGKLTLGQRAGIRDLSRVQSGLKDEATELIDKLGEGAPVFTLTLKRAAQGMEDAAKRLQALQTDEATIRAEKLASSRFQQLVDSLKPDKGKPGQNQPPQQGGDQGGQGQTPGGGDGIPAAAQIKMLRSLQLELNERTDFYDELLRRQKELNPEQTAELERLHQDQGTLADIVRDLTKPKKDDGEQ